MQRPRVPGSVTLGRVLLIVESVLWLLGAVAIGAVGAWFLSAGGNLVNRLHQVGYSGANIGSAAAGIIGGTVLAFAVIILVISIIGIWSGGAMGRLTAGPRVTGIVLACLGLLIGIVGALDSARATVHTTTGAFRGSPIPGIVILVVNLLILWALGFSGKTRAAFRRLPPPSYPAMAPAGYGQPSPYGQPGVSGAYPPPPPPPPPPGGLPGFGPAPGSAPQSPAPPAWQPGQYPAPPTPPGPAQGYPAAPPPPPPTYPPSAPPPPA